MGHTKKTNKECTEEIHAIEWCEACYAVICNTCKDKDCTLLDMIFQQGIKPYRPAPNPYGVTY